MTEPIRSQSVPLPTSVELDLDDLTQQIDAPLGDSGNGDEPTLTQMDFEGIELALDFPRRR